VSKQKLNPPIGPFGALKIIKNQIKFKKLQPAKVKGSRTQKKKSLNVTKASSQTPKKIVVSCSIVIRVQR